MDLTTLAEIVAETATTSAETATTSACYGVCKPLRGSRPSAIQEGNAFHDEYTGCTRPQVEIHNFAVFELLELLHFHSPGVAERGGGERVFFGVLRLRGAEGQWAERL